MVPLANWPYDDSTTWQQWELEAARGRLDDVLLHRRVAKTRLDIDDGKVRYQQWQRHREQEQAMSQALRSMSHDEARSRAAVSYLRHPGLRDA